MSPGEETCPWCGSQISSHEQGVTVGPPPRSAAETHQWVLHARCAEDWQSFANQLFRLSRIGAHKTLIEYPKNHGTDDLLETGETDRCNADAPETSHDDR